MTRWSCWAVLLSGAAVLQIFSWRGLVVTPPAPPAVQRLQMVKTAGVAVATSIDDIFDRVVKLRQPDELAKAALRQEIYALSGHEIPLPLLTRVTHLDDLNSLVATYRRCLILISSGL